MLEKHATVSNRYNSIFLEKLERVFYELSILPQYNFLRNILWNKEKILHIHTYFTKCVIISCETCTLIYNKNTSSSGIGKPIQPYIQEKYCIWIKRSTYHNIWILYVFKCETNHRKLKLINIDSTWKTMLKTCALAVSCKNDTHRCSCMKLLLMRVFIWKLPIAINANWKWIDVENCICLR